MEIIKHFTIATASVNEATAIKYRYNFVIIFDKLSNLIANKISNGS